MHVRFASAESLRATRMGWFIVLNGVRDPLKGVLGAYGMGLRGAPASAFALGHARPLRVRRENYRNRIGARPFERSF
jgi:hypothetical protein